MIEMVLATDMAEHTRHLTELQDAVEQGKDAASEGGKPYVWSDPGGQELLLSVRWSNVSSVCHSLTHLPPVFSGWFAR